MHIEVLALLYIICIVLMNVRVLASELYLLALLK